MSLKEILRLMVVIFPRVTTGTLISATIFCTIFFQETTFTVRDFWKLLFLAFGSSCTAFLLYSKRELGKWELLMRSGLSLFVVLAFILTFAYRWEWIDRGSFVQPAIFALLIIGVDSLVKFISFKRDKATAEQLNEALKRYHQ